MNKNERKVARKKQRILKHLSGNNLLNLTPCPSKTVLVTNAGLTTGASRESVLARFLPHAAPRRVLMAPERQFCFVEFGSVEEAQQAVQAVDGTAGDPVLLLAYMKQVPTSLCAPAAPLALPPGATLVNHFVSDEEEKSILSQLCWGDNGSMKHRQVLHFGYEFDYSINNVRTERALPGGLPGWSGPLVQRLLAEGLLTDRPDQITVNRYLPGQGIPPHVDTHSAFEGPLVSVSLGAATTMEFSRTSPEPAAAAVRLPARSALVMDGEARYLWTHGITPRKSDVTRTECGELTLTARQTRVSVTLRRVRRAPCRCQYPAQCDSQTARPQQTVAAGRAHLLEKTYVAEVYESIAGHFSSTRHKPWPRVRAFVGSLPTGTLLLDVGCGNGKYLGLRTGLYELGVDQSVRLCGIGRSRGNQMAAATCLPLPVRDAAVDACLCIAVIHHLATRERRADALAELARVLRAGGRALVYVWALEQRRGLQAAGYLKPGRRPPTQCDDVDELPLPVHTNRTEFRQQDMLVPWKLRSDESEPLPSSVHHRYYHVYRQGELEQDVCSVPGLRVAESWYDQGNWCVLLQKDA